MCLMDRMLHTVLITPKNSLPLSDKIYKGSPCKWNQKLHRLASTSAGIFVFKGRNAVHFVHRSTIVSTYLYPSSVKEPGE